MESFFFNITDTKYKISNIGKDSVRVDISNGVVFYDINGFVTLDFKNLDRFVMFVVTNSSKTIIEDYISSNIHTVLKDSNSIFISSKQNFKIKSQNTFILFVADFFLKRYLSGVKDEPIDYLYSLLQDDISLQEISSFKNDALISYIVKNILDVNNIDRIKSLKAEYRVIEFLIDRLSLLDIFDERLSEEEKRVALKAKNILLKKFTTNIDIKDLAHLCATNETKLKKVFKKVYKTTIHNYILFLRLNRANQLLKDEELSISEIAKRVGYKHQGYFSRLFFKRFGVYPKELKNQK